MQVREYGIVSHLPLQPEGVAAVGGEDGAVKESGMLNLGEVVYHFIWSPRHPKKKERKKETKSRG